jgi:hypothetical protein
VITKVENSHNMLSVSWRASKSGVVIQSKSERPESQGRL